MSIDFNIYSQVYFEWNEPVPYKEFTITPIKFRNYYLFRNSYGVLAIDKNNIENGKYIGMSYLDFLVKILMNPEAPTCQICKDKFVVILQLSLGAKSMSYRFDENGRTVLLIDGVEVKYKEFDDIRRIILYQNIPGYDDEYIDPDLKKDIELANHLKGKNIEYPSAEKQIALVTVETGLTRKEIEEMTYREFLILFTTMSESIDYKLNHAAELQGTKFKQPIEHLIYKKKKNKYSDAFMDMGELKEKFKPITG